MVVSWVSPVPPHPPSLLLRLRYHHGYLFGTSPWLQWPGLEPAQPRLGQSHTPGNLKWCRTDTEHVQPQVLHLCSGLKLPPGNFEKHTHTHTLSHAIHSCTLTHTHAHTHACTLTFEHTLTCTHPCMHAHSCAHVRTRTHSRHAHSHTHAHTHLIYVRASSAEPPSAASSGTSAQRSRHTRTTRKLE